MYLPVLPCERIRQIIQTLFLNETNLWHFSAGASLYLLADIYTNGNKSVKTNVDPTLIWTDPHIFGHVVLYLVPFMFPLPSHSASLHDFMIEAYFDTAQKVKLF